VLDVTESKRAAELEQRNADALREAEQLRELSWRMLQVQEEERRHVARELHDSASQLLAVLDMTVSSIAQKAPQDAPEVTKQAEGAVELVRQLIKEIRTASYLLHPPLLDEDGLDAALSLYINGVATRSGLAITLDIHRELGRLPREIEVTAFRLVQECLTNIHRHSESKSAAIRVSRRPGEIEIEIRDQGIGISPEKLKQIQVGAAGVGIRGMRERLRQFRGEMKIDSDGRGTRIVATIPVSEPGSEGSAAQTEKFESVS